MERREETDYTGGMQVVGSEAAGRERDGECRHGLGKGQVCVCWWWEGGISFFILSSRLCSPFLSYRTTSHPLKRLICRQHCLDENGPVPSSSCCILPGTATSVTLPCTAASPFKY